MNRGIYNKPVYFVVWNDQFYSDPAIGGCGDSCSQPWGHSKGMLAWNEDGDGMVLQVTTPSWPAAGSKRFPRKTDGNTLGCVLDDNVKVSQHFFALRLTHGDVVMVLKALTNASVVTDPANSQVVNNGGPADIKQLVESLGAKAPVRQSHKGPFEIWVYTLAKPRHAAPHHSCRPKASSQECISATNHETRDALPAVNTGSALLAVGRQKLLRRQKTASVKRLVYHCKSDRQKAVWLRKAQSLLHRSQRARLGCNWIVII